VSRLLLLNVHKSTTENNNTRHTGQGTTAHTTSSRHAYKHPKTCSGTTSTATSPTCSKTSESTAQTQHDNDPHNASGTNTNRSVMQHDSRTACSCSPTPYVGNGEQHSKQ